MKTLYLLRHAKSSWENPTQIDFERPLNERGQIAAPLMGRLMREQGFVPDLIVSSPAIRARQTAEMVKNAANFAVEIRFDARIYEAGVGDLLEVLSETPDKIKSLLLVGHNPGMENLIKNLTAETREMTTAALAELKLKIYKWKKIDQPGGKLFKLFKPKEIAERLPTNW